MATAEPTLSAGDFVHLHNHTQYSLLDGLTKIPALVEHVAASGMQAVAITDHGTLSGVIEFYEEALQHEIKPIIGLEAYVAARGLGDKDPAKDKLNYHLILLAMNNEGYQNLMRLATIAQLEGMYYRPRIDHKQLEKYNAGFIVLSGCIGGEVGDNLRQGQYAKAKEAAQWYKKVFGDRYYLEVQDHGHPKHPSAWDEQMEVTKQTLKLGKELKIPCVVTCDAHYLKHADQEAHEILLCVQTGSFLSDEQRMSLKNFELHVTDPKEVIERWGGEHPELILNSRAIAERCNINIDLGEILIPKFPLPKGETEKTHLHRLVYQGLAWRYGMVSEAKAAQLSINEAKKTLPKEVAERAVYELEVVNQMNFNGYFLIIADFVGWGKAQGIVFGPGRGSAAGSIIAYALKITELDPLVYDLLFERFLNPDRISMPDIDIDIQDTRRDEVIQYCIDKYGSDRVANIVTFGRMAARNAVRDVARVLEVPYAEADRFAKMIPPPIQGRHIPLKQSLQENYELKNEYSTNETAKRVFDLAMQLEGTIRSHGVHAAGVVIAPEDIVHYTPLEMAQKGVIATQYSMGPIEELGLLKIDFLGLSNLTIIKNALRIIKRVYGDDIDINQIPLDDTETFGLLTRGDTTGVFQLESAGMKRYLKQLKPTTFEDIISMVALYRPGPMQFIDQFIARKNGQDEITYLHPAMKPALENTYGVIVTQEQVMQISKEMCGFSGGQADTLRKAIGKKNPQILAKLKDEFIEGAIKTVGAERNLMEKLWRQIEDFAAYCFNKAHSACYAMIAYQTAYLKAHYPAAMMAALMTSDFDNTDRLAIEITECQHMGIAVLPPDINESFAEFGVVPGEKQTIRFSLSAIKNVGASAVEEILTVREADGPFANLEDFLSRVPVRTVNRKTLESLIKAGALDRFAERSILLHNLEVLSAYAARLQKQTASGQTDLFGNLIEEVSVKPKLALEQPASNQSTSEQLQWERELLGLYLSQHPLKAFEQFLSEQTVPLNSLTTDHDGRTVSVGGTLTDIREITTKNGQKMAFIKLEDYFGQVELILFPNAYQQTAGLWQRDRIVLARGKVSNRDRTGKNGGELKIMVNEAREVNAEEAKNYQSTGKKKRPPKVSAKKETAVAAQTASKSAATAKLADERVYIRLPNGEDQQTLLKLKSTIDDFRGETEVVLVLGSDESRQIIKLPSRIDKQEPALSRLMEAVGADNVIVQ